MTEELLPCPFCGEAAEMLKGERTLIIQCVNGCAQMAAGSDDYPYAAEAWNTRTPTTLGEDEK